MRFFTLLATAAMFAAPTAALADDEMLDVLPPNYTTFVSASFLYSFGILDQDFDITDGIDRVSGSFDPEYALGAKVEAGVFTSERVRFSVDLRYSKTEYDSVTLGGVTAAVPDVDEALEADRFQAFANVAYEFPLADIVTLPLLERTRVFGIAGVGVTNYELTIDGDSEDDTAFTAKVGLGTVFDLTERVALVGETNYIFGSDFEFEEDGVRIEVANEEIVSTIGLRFSF